jgi:hypothetical protein
LLARLDYRFQRFSEILSYLPRAWRLVWRACVWLVGGLWLVLLLIQGLLRQPCVYLTRLLVDQLIIALKGERTWAQMQPVVWLAVLLACHDVAG